MAPKLLQPLVPIPYHPCPNTISTPFQASPSPPLTFPHTILPHVKVLVNQSSPLSPGGGASSNSASAPSPIPLLWATRRLAVTPSCRDGRRLLQYMLVVFYPCTSIPGEHLTWSALNKFGLPALELTLLGGLLGSPKLLERTASAS